MYFVRSVQSSVDSSSRGSLKIAVMLPTPSDIGDISTKSEQLVYKPKSHFYSTFEDVPRAFLSKHVRIGNSAQVQSKLGGFLSD